MIKYHPSEHILQSYVQGELCASLSVAVSMHVAMCPQCQLLTSQFEASCAHSFAGEDMDLQGDENWDDLIAQITEDTQFTDQPAPAPLEIEVKGEQFVLPSSLQNVGLSGWLKLGKLSRSRLNLGDGKLHASLLHIEKGGSVPQHTHKGFELTLLLSGTFKDEMDSYVPGDFIMLDGSHEHSPVATESCLCFTLADDALHFSQGLSQLFNPIGKLIY
ncbi:transcriptional regulator [Pseudoalteromonas rubra]|uniref:Transcriptional regulator n=1 Tax=Pseudoalteromonas rubra TaxID=43658 RepID=A0A5S3WUI6_9GAMM|nr:ChrR family anti-sigma-E factor [Pseudoalteromonas rubra]TMP30113.1 transcriptional regulator [Pseudoalteromonas rubra]TMP32020.1 transcriptional regulator [Pseudoalteromonas rubra]